MAHEADAAGRRDAPLDEGEPPDPVRAGADRERGRFVRALVFVGLLGVMVLVPVCAALTGLR